MSRVLFAQTSAPSSQPQIDPALLQKLKAIDARTAAITDMTAKFEQQKFTPLLKKPITSRGTVIAKSAQMLWDTTEPQKTQMRVDNQSLQILYVDDKVLEVYPIAGKFQAMASSPLPRLDTLMQQFNISENNGVLRLTPRDPGLAEHVDHIDVKLDEKLGVLREFELTDPDGERTVIRFSDYQLNRNLPESALDLKIPEGTKTVHPLDRAP